MRITMGCIAVAVAACAAVPASGKCALAEYDVAGSIREHLSGKSVGGAAIYLFMDDHQGTWAKGYETKYPDFYKSDDGGRFRGKVFFPTARARQSERCDARPKRLTLFATSPGYLSKRLSFELKDLEIEEKDGRYTITLPTIELLRSP